MKSIHVSVLDREGVDGADADAAVGPNVVLLIGWRARAIAALVVLAICASLGLSAWAAFRPRISAEDILKIEKAARLKLAQEQQTIRALKAQQEK